MKTSLKKHSVRQINFALEPPTGAATVVHVVLKHHHTGYGIRDRDLRIIDSIFWLELMENLWMFYLCFQIVLPLTSLQFVTIFTAVSSLMSCIRWQFWASKFFIRLDSLLKILFLLFQRKIKLNSGIHISLSAISKEVDIKVEKNKTEYKLNK